MTNFTIECPEEQMAKIEAIAFSETKIEVGGFLVGTYDENGAVVTDVLPAHHSVGQSTQLTFTHDTWNALYADLKEIDGALVGWFHSHPNFGVFLSEHDQFIQQNFFGANGNITIVVDPIRGRRGWFYSQDGKIKKYESEMDTTRERLGVSATNSDENIEAVMGTTNNGVTTGKVVIISAIMSLLGTFLGYGLSIATSGSSGQSEVSALNQRIVRLEAELGIASTYVPTQKAPVTKAPTTHKESTSSKDSTKPNNSSTVNPSKNTNKNSSATETTTPTILGQTIVKLNKPCDPTKDKDEKNILVCKVKDVAKPTVGTWVNKPPAPVNKDK